jgi:hypothetical protein
MGGLVQILAKAPNLDQMSTIPYSFDVCRAPRRATHGAAILAKSNMSAIRVSGQYAQKTETFIKIVFRDQISQMGYQNDRNK